MELTYKLLDPEREIESLDSLRALRGAGKKVFQELGGGEKFLRQERTKFAVTALGDGKV